MKKDIDNEKSYRHSLFSLSVRSIFFLSMVVLACLTLALGWTIKEKLGLKGQVFDILFLLLGVLLFSVYVLYKRRVSSFQKSRDPVGIFEVDVYSDDIDDSELNSDFTKRLLVYRDGIELRGYFTEYFIPYKRMTQVQVRRVGTRSGFLSVGFSFGDSREILIKTDLADDLSIFSLTCNNLDKIISLIQTLNTGSARIIRSDMGENVSEENTKAPWEINPDWLKSDEAKKKVPELIAMLSSEKWNVRSAVADALGEIGDNRAVDPLISWLKEEDGWVRSTAAKVLGKIGDARAVEPLISLLNDRHDYVRKAVVEALGKIDPDWPRSGYAKRQVPEFISALKDDDSEVRKVAAWALGKIRDSSAVEPLISLTENEDEDVRTVAAEALENIYPGWRSSNN